MGICCSILNICLKLNKLNVWMKRTLSWCMTALPPCCHVMQYVDCGQLPLCSAWQNDKAASSGTACFILTSGAVFVFFLNVLLRVFEWLSLSKTFIYFLAFMFINILPKFALKAYNAVVIFNEVPPTIFIRSHLYALWTTLDGALIPEDGNLDASKCLILTTISCVCTFLFLSIISFSKYGVWSQ